MWCVEVSDGKLFLGVPVVGYYAYVSVAHDLLTKHIGAVVFEQSVVRQARSEKMTLRRLRATDRDVQ